MVHAISVPEDDGVGRQVDEVNLTDAGAGGLTADTTFKVSFV